MNRRVQYFCDWLERIDCVAHVADRPEFGFFADMSEDELVAAEHELVRRLAVAGTEQDVHCAFLAGVEVLQCVAQNDQ